MAIFTIRWAVIELDGGPMSAYPSKADVRCDEFVAVFPPQPTFLQYYDFYVGV
jgi:hypothetical protein